MELLFLNHNVIWRSAFNRCFQLGKQLVSRGHRVTILTNSPNELFRWKESMIEGVRVVESPDLFFGPLRTGWDPVNVLRRSGWACRESARLQKTGSAVVVHAFDTRPTVIHPALVLSKMLQCPLVIDWGDWWGRGGAIRLRKPFFLNFAFEPIETYYEEHFKMEADWLTCISDPLRERSIELGYPKNRITVIRNPVDVAETKLLDRAEGRQKLGLDSNRFYAIFSGFVLYDLDLVLDSMQALASRVKERVGLILTGSAKTSRTQDYSFEIVQPGVVSRGQLNQYLSASNVALMPLRDHIANRARWPTKVGDYLAAGLPVVLNPVGDVARILQNAGLEVFCDSTAESFAEKLKWFLQNPLEANQLGLKGRKFVEEEFNWAKEAVRFEEIYKNLLSERKNFVHE
jgi:glycosyltransferase involved in cell wall biosynthesis